MKLLSLCSLCFAALDTKSNTEDVGPMERLNLGDGGEMLYNRRGFCGLDTSGAKWCFCCCSLVTRTFFSPENLATMFNVLQHVTLVLSWGVFEQRHSQCKNASTIASFFFSSFNGFLFFLQMFVPFSKLTKILLSGGVCNIVQILLLLSSSCCFSLRQNLYLHHSKTKMWDIISVGLFHCDR